MLMCNFLCSNFLSVWWEACLHARFSRFIQHITANIAILYDWSKWFNVLQRSLMRNQLFSCCVALSTIHSGIHWTTCMCYSGFERFGSCHSTRIVHLPRPDHGIYWVSVYSLRFWQSPRKIARMCCCSFERLFLGCLFRWLHWKCEAIYIRDILQNTPGNKSYVEFALSFIEMSSAGVAYLCNWPWCAKFPL